MKPPEMPSILRNALDGARAIARKAADAVAPATRAEKERRVAICETCPKHADSRCSVCGCPIVHVAHFLQSACPDNPPRW